MHRRYTTRAASRNVREAHCVHDDGDDDRDDATTTATMTATITATG
jgi:hypothetical protein